MPSPARRACSEAAVTTATAPIVVDLSKPHEAVPTLEYWLRKTRAAVDRTFDKLRCARWPERSEPPQETVQGERRAAHAGASGDATDSLGEGTAADVTPMTSPRASSRGALRWCPNRRRAAPRRIVQAVEATAAAVRALRRLAHFNGASLFYVDCVSGTGSTQARWLPQTVISRISLCGV